MSSCLAQAAPGPHKGLLLVFAGDRSDGIVTALDRSDHGCEKANHTGSSAGHVYRIGNAANGSGPQAAFHGISRSGAR